MRSFIVYCPEDERWLLVESETDSLDDAEIVDGYEDLAEARKDHPRAKVLKEVTWS